MQGNGPPKKSGLVGSGRRINKYGQTLNRELGASFACDRRIYELRDCGLWEWSLETISAAAIEDKLDLHTKAIH